jgi:hypothetical protein
MSEGKFKSKAENIVALVATAGKASAPQVESILLDVYQGALERGAERMIQLAGQAMKDGDGQSYNILMGQVRELRALKSQ